MIWNKEPTIRSNLIPTSLKSHIDVWIIYANKGWEYIWLGNCINKNSNKVLFMLPKDDMPKIYLKINTRTCSDKEQEQM